jgi:hypothetical protein
MSANPVQKVLTHFVLRASRVAGTTVPDAVAPSEVPGAPADDDACPDGVGAADSVADSDVAAADPVDFAADDPALDDATLEVSVTGDPDADDPAEDATVEDAVVEIPDDASVGVPDSPELQPATASAAAATTDSMLARTVCFIFVVPFDMVACASACCLRTLPRDRPPPGQPQR